mmetsp:Transcript_26207/g.84639  ORF Transcript_26207/g.84639 Transcript_26207/m.84639 type:complete len:201 (-) Transcript_26207:748-1350(-)
MLGEELVDGDELVGDALDVVQPVHSQNELQPIELGLQLDHLVLQLLGRQHRIKARVVNPDWECVDCDCGAVECVEDVGALHVDVGTEDGGAGCHEVSDVVVDLKPDEVGGEHAPQDLLAQRKRDVDLRRREGRVQKPADLHLGLGLAEHLRQQRQVVVVDPDEVVVCACGDGQHNVAEVPVQGRITVPSLVDHVDVGVEH